MIEGADWLEAFFDEFENFPHGEHDDIVDAVSIAFNAIALPSTVWDDRDLISPADELGAELTDEERTAALGEMNAETKELIDWLDTPRQ